MSERPHTTVSVGALHPVSSDDTRRHLRSANRHLLAVPRFRLNTYGRSQLLARWPGTHSRIFFGIQRAARTALGVYLKRTCSRVTSASSALGVLNDYALYKSTHSLTHSPTTTAEQLEGTGADIIYSSKDDTNLQSSYINCILILFL